MDAGTKVYKAVLYTDPTQYAKPYYITEGTTTGIVLSGTEMVRVWDALFPITDGWHSTEAAAKAEAATELCRSIGKMQAALDSMRDEILHDALTTEEAVA